MRKNEYFVLILSAFFGCAHQTPAADVRISLVNHDHAVQISGFDKAIIDDIGRDTTSGVWQSFLPVYKMPADTDMKDFQNPQPGKYAVQDSLVVFTPDTAFKKGQTYFVRYFDYQGVKDAWQVLRDKKRPGTAKHRDLLFRY